MTTPLKKRLMKKRRFSETVSALYQPVITPLAKRPKTTGPAIPDAGQFITAYYYDKSRGLPLSQLPKQFKVVTKSSSRLVTLTPLDEKIVFDTEVPAGEDLVSTCNTYVITFEHEDE